VQDALEVERHPAGVGLSSRGGRGDQPQQPPLWEEGVCKCDFPDFRVEVATGGGEKNLIGPGLQSHLRRPHPAHDICPR
jgi:hypothetical protein